MRGSGLILVLLSALPAAAAAPRQGPWNVILVIEDTVRADHTTPYGYARDTTPAMAELARKGAVFEAALAQSNWTFPALASMFTGQRPATHGVFVPSDRLGPAQPTLAELFRERGFQTAAFTAGFIDTRSMGLDRGFDYVAGFHRPWDRGQGLGSMGQAMPPALRWLESKSSSTFFLLIHGADAHYPYDCPRDYFLRFIPPNPDADLPGPGDVALLQAFDLAAGVDWRGMPPEFIRTAEAMKKKPEDMARLSARLSARYDGCMSYGDSRLSALYAAMTRLRLWGNTILIATADHGEALGEHGGFGHYQRPMYDEVLRVPLVVWHPGVPGLAGRRVREPVEEIDLLPTLMDWEGWHSPPGTQGRSFRSLLEGAPRPGAGAGRYAQAARHGTGKKVLDLEAFRSGDWKVIRQGSRWELFDLAADPGESRSQLDREPERFMQLAAEMMRLKTRP